MKYTKKQIEERLFDEDYPHKEVIINTVIKQLENLSDKGQILFDSWMESGKIAEFDILGITPTYLRKFQKMKDPAIILAYDGLIKRPEFSAKILKEPLILNKRKR